MLHKVIHKFNMSPIKCNILIFEGYMENKHRRLPRKIYKIIYNKAALVI